MLSGFGAYIMFSFNFEIICNCLEENCLYRSKKLARAVKTVIRPKELAKLETTMKTSYCFFTSEFGSLDLPIMRP